MEQHNHSFDPERLLMQVLAHLDVKKGPNKNGEHTCWCIFHPDGQGKPPHQANLSVSERGYYCHACHEKGSLAKLARHFGIEVPARIEIEAVYGYFDEEGTLLYQVVRRPGKRFQQRRPNGRGGWIWNLKETRRVLYNLPSLMSQSDSTVFIVEGEKDVDRLSREGVLATTNSGGAGKWRAEYNATLLGRNIVIISDNDTPGREHAESVARSLYGFAKSIRILILPDLPEKGDVSDWLANGHSIDELRALAGRAKYWESSEDVGTGGKSDGGNKKKGETKASRLVKLVNDSGVELFHDERDEPYAAVQFESSRRIVSLNSKRFKQWLGHLAWKETHEAFGKDTIASAQQTLTGIAIYEGREHRLHVRSAWYEGDLWIDLDGIRAVQVGSQGWEVMEEPPILFRSFPHQHPLPTPVCGGDPWQVLQFVNLRNEMDSLLYLCYLVASYVPDVSIVALVAHGVQGSAKSTFLTLTKKLVDPSSPALRGGVRDQTEYAQAAFQNRALFFDNLTHMPDWLSDALCRTVTGDGWSKRTLFSDEDTTFFEFQRLVGIGGINLVGDKPDLLDRSLIFPLEPISESERKDDEEIRAQFDAIRAEIFGGLLDALCVALRERSLIRLSALPRMADFARLGAGAAIGLGRKPEEFLKAYDRNVSRQNSAAIEASLVAQAVLVFMSDKREWKGSPSGLLERLNPIAEDLQIDVSRNKNWPKVPVWVTRRLNETYHNLLSMGVEVSIDREGSERTITIRKGCENTVISVIASKSSPDNDKEMTLNSGDDNNAVILEGDHAQGMTTDENTVTDAVTVKSNDSNGSDSNDTNDSKSAALSGKEGLQGSPDSWPEEWQRVWVARTRELVETRNLGREEAEKIAKIEIRLSYPEPPPDEPPDLFTKADGAGS